MISVRMIRSMYVREKQESIQMITYRNKFILWIIKIKTNQIRKINKYFYIISDLVFWYFYGTFSIQKVKLFFKQINRETELIFRCQVWQIIDAEKKPLQFGVCLIEFNFIFCVFFKPLLKLFLLKTFASLFITLSTLFSL